MSRYYVTAGLESPVLAEDAVGFLHLNDRKSINALVYCPVYF